MGGRGLRSTYKINKKTLKVITRDRLFTKAALHTCFFGVESALNNWPILPLSDDMNECEALTAIHIWFAHSPSHYVVGVFRDNEINCRKKWLKIQVPINMFWSLWF